MALIEEYDGTHSSGFSAYGSRWIAQTFQTSQVSIIESVSLRMYQSISPNGDDIYVSIRAIDENGHPTGADLSDTPSVNINDLPAYSGSGTTTWTNFEFSTTPSLSSLAIVIRIPDAGNSNQGIYCSGRSTDDYSDGNSELSTDSGSNWSAISGDIFFRLYGTNISSQGTKTVTSVCYAWLPTESYEGDWPRQKPDIDPDKEWDEAAQEWVTVTNEGGGRYREQIIAIGHNSDGTGCIYYGEN